MATDSDNKLRQIEDIKHKTQAVIDDRKNVNNLVDVLTVLTDDLDQTRGDSGDKCSPLMVDTIIRSLNKIFIRYIHTKELVISDGDTDANLTYKKWLTGVYDRTNDTLLRLIGDNRYSKATQKLALNSLMKCVAEEGMQSSIAYSPRVVLICVLLSHLKANTRSVGIYPLIVRTRSPRIC
jgi:hypothetical protein